MAKSRKHQIIEIDKMSDLGSSYFIRRGIVYSRDCDNNRLNVWIEGTIFENLEIFYHCENEAESTPEKAFDLFEVGRKVLVLHKFVYNKENVEQIERTVIGLKYNAPEGIDNLQPCVVKRFFAKTKKVVDGGVTYFYHWICIDENDNITIIKIKNNEDRTEAEVFLEQSFYSTLEKALYLGVVDHGALNHSATKSFMMTNDHDFRERWVATPCSLFKDQCEVINIMPLHWTIPPPCDAEDLPCPPNRFYCNIEKRILVWYGTYEVFIGATIVRFDTDTTYTWNCVAASGISIPGDTYHTLADTAWDLPLNMISGLNWVNDTEISFYLPCGINRSPGQATIDWIDYVWGSTVDAGNIDEINHWYWTATGFEEKLCATLTQTVEDSGIENIDKVQETGVNCPDYHYQQEECEAHTEYLPYGHYTATIQHFPYTNSSYKMFLIADELIADTIIRSDIVNERKIANCARCGWNALDSTCKGSPGRVVTNATRYVIHNLQQKIATGMSADWLSNNVFYDSKDISRKKCLGDAQQTGEYWWPTSIRLWKYWGGPTRGEFADCYWPIPGICDGQICKGECFEYPWGGSDWYEIETDEIILLGSGGPHGSKYKWQRTSDIDEYSDLYTRKFKLGDAVENVIEFDATKIYKTYYLDDRATCHEQGLMVAGKGVKDSAIFWEIYHDGLNITEKLFEALDCEQSELDEIGLI